MTIINHGTWTRYVPEVWPEGLPENIIFCKRDADGTDWYEFIYNGAVFAPNSIKLTVLDGKVGAATRDASRLFPQSCALLEITEDNSTEDVQEAYGGRLYDVATNTLSSAPALAPAPPITRRQLLIGLSQEGFITSQEAIDSARGVGIPVGIQEVIDELPTQAEKDAATITWYAMSEAEPTNQLVGLLAAKRGMTCAQTDDLFRQWSLL